MMNEIDTIEMLRRMLDATTLRQEVLANNLANVDTPGFVRQDVRFREALSEAMESNSRIAADDLKPEIYHDELSPGRPDGNNVSMQREMGEMMQNEILYQFSTKLIASKFNGLIKAIKGGKA
ncbi:MAG: flagellar basal body rod protein FlgB [Spartobacteria bacterium]|nr:flagellar basal body rod protein FlgB [Spartobacteria bacterium]